MKLLPEMLIVSSLSLLLPALEPNEIYFRVLKCSPLLLFKILLPRKSDSSGLSSREPLVANKQNGHFIGHNFSRLHNEWHCQP